MFLTVFDQGNAALMSTDCRSDLTSFKNTVLLKTVLLLNSRM